MKIMRMAISYAMFKVDTRILSNVLVIVMWSAPDTYGSVMWSAPDTQKHVAGKKR